jgi:hypothetical protein
MSTIINAQVIASFEVELPKATNGIDVPVTISLDDWKIDPENLFSLVEVIGKQKINVPYQLREKKIMAWLVQSSGKEEKKRSYQLIKGAPQPTGQVLTENIDGALTIRYNDQNLLRYYYKKVNPPAGIDTVFGRSGFIHPLWTPHGQELTRIQPPDHYHHYGIWNPWAHTLFEKDTIDFWNIGDKKGFVRFARFLSQNSGAVFAEFQAFHEHVVLKKDGSEKIALNELQTITVYKPSTDYFIVDITSMFTCGTSSPLLLLAYRYAGLGWRATEFWNKDNCEVLTSEGKTRKDTDGSKARWCIVQGALPGNDSGGAVILSNPANYNHPEPVRIWDEKANNGRGDMFFNFAPTKDKDWLLEPGTMYKLKYRFVVFSGKFDAAKAESAWQYFAVPPKVVKK